MEFAKTVSTTDTSGIYAKTLSRGAKVFTAWDSEKYYLGNPGDYIACREDDPHDIYIIRGSLFNRLYSEV